MNEGMKYVISSCLIWFYWPGMYEVFVTVMPEIQCEVTQITPLQTSFLYGNIINCCT